MKQSRGWVVTAALAVIAGQVAAATVGAVQSPGTTPPGSTPDAALYDAAFARATEIAGGEQIGGSINLLGVIGGEELDALQSTYEAFEDATGISIEFEGTRDMAAVLQTRVDGGNPPDAIMTASIGQLRDLGAAGDMIALDDILDMATVSEEFDAGLLGLGTVDDTLYGVFNTAALKGLIYYNTAVYDGPLENVNWDQMNEWQAARAAEGITPWCIGLESGAATGWPATDWIEHFLLKQASLDIYDQWWQGDLSWNAPEIKAAWEAFGAIATDPTLVNGGPDAIVSTSFASAANPLFSDPPGCLVSHQADFLAASLPSEVEAAVQGETFNVFMFPSIASVPENAGHVEIAGGMLGIMNDTPQTRAFIEYSASPEAQALIGATGRWLAPNRAVDPAVYATPISAFAADTLANAVAVRFDASDLMPASMNEAFWRGVLDYVTGADSLDSILERLDGVREEAYAD